MRGIKPNMPFRDFRRGCCGCWVLLVLLVMAMLVAGCLLGVVLTRGSTPSARAASLIQRQALLLAPSVSPAPSRPTPYGDFFSNRIAVEIAPGLVLLSSTADGRGPIMTDDQALVQIVHADGSRSEWSQDFRARDHSGVVPLPAQDLTTLFQTGLNQVTITLRDLTPDTYSSLAYYLIFAEDDVPSATPRPTPSALATPSEPGNTASPIPSNTRVDLLATPPPDDWVIGGTVNGEPTVSTALPISATETPAPVIANTEIRAWPDLAPQIVLGGGVLLAGIAALSVLLRRRTLRATNASTLRPPAVLGVGQAQGKLGHRTPPALFGWLDLYDRQTHESHAPLDLSQWPHGLTIQLDPMRITKVAGLCDPGGVASAEPAGDETDGIAEIRPTSDGATLISRNGSTVIAPEWEDENLQSEDQLLQDGVQLVIGGRLELGYRNPRQRTF